jgi:hypothetical protein
LRDFSQKVSKSGNNMHVMGLPREIAEVMVDAKECGME